MISFKPTTVRKPEFAARPLHPHKYIKKPSMDECRVFDRDSFVAYVFGDVPTAKKIAKKALSDIQAHHGGLKDALKEGDSENLHYNAHSLKGVSGLLKCTQLSTCAKEIEALAKDQLLHEANRRAPDLALQIQRATKALHDFVAVNEAEDK